MIFSSVQLCSGASPITGILGTFASLLLSHLADLEIQTILNRGRAESRAAFHNGAVCLEMPESRFSWSAVCAALSCILFNVFASYVYGDLLVRHQHLAKKMEAFLQAEAAEMTSCGRHLTPGIEAVAGVFFGCLVAQVQNS